MNSGTRNICAINWFCPSLLQGYFPDKSLATYGFLTWTGVRLQLIWLQLWHKNFFYKNIFFFSLKNASHQRREPSHFTSPPKMIIYRLLCLCFVLNFVRCAGIWPIHATIQIVQYTQNRCLTKESRIYISNFKFLRYGIPMFKIKRSQDRLLFTWGFLWYHSFSHNRKSFQCVQKKWIYPKPNRWLSVSLSITQCKHCFLPLPPSPPLTPQRRIYSIHNLSIYSLIINVPHQIGSTPDCHSCIRKR